MAKTLSPIYFQLFSARKIFNKKFQKSIDKTKSL